MEIAKSLITVLSKRRRVVLDLKGRPKLAGLPIRILGTKVRLYARFPGGKADYVLIAMADINGVWDPSSGDRLWQRCN